MNRGQARTRLRAYLREPKAATWSDDVLDGLLDEAQTEVFYSLVSQNVPLFTKAQRAAWPSEQREAKESSLFGRRVAQYRMLAYLKTDADPSRTNVPILLQPLHEMKQTSTDDSYGPYLTIAGDVDNERGYNQFAYLATGNRIIIDPIPLVTIYLYAEAVWEPEELKADSVELLDGEIPQFHYLVAVKAALNALCQTADKDAYAQLTDRWQRAWDTMSSFLRMSKQSQSNRAPPWNNPEV